MGRIEWTLAGEVSPAGDFVVRGCVILGLCGPVLR